MFKNIYKDRKVLITGHTGFKGSWLSAWLNILGAEVCGYSLPPETEPSLFKIANIADGMKSISGNILDCDTLEKAFADFRPEIVFHLAAQPLVRLSYEKPVLTYQTNVIGTLNVLEAARKTDSVKAFVNITTDKCYENREIRHGYREDEPMGGYDMYSSSKGCVEIMSSSYRRSFLQDGGYAMATARAGNVIGGGDWAADRIVPDCVRSIEAGIPIEIRSPNAIRPWQHVLEPLSGYLLLGQKLLESGSKYAEGFNFGPENDGELTVVEVASQIIQEYGKGTIKIHRKDNLHEANLLMLDITKAKTVLGWKPAYTAKEAISRTVSWYKQFYAGADAKELTERQIREYESLRGNIL